LDHLAEDVIEALVAEIVFLLGDPFLKAEMRLDDECRHVEAAVEAEGITGSSHI
jgi:hypothetical protein